jgi:hypothetical protein
VHLFGNGLGVVGRQLGPRTFLVQQHEVKHCPIYRADPDYPTSPQVKSLRNPNILILRTSHIRLRIGQLYGPRDKEENRATITSPNWHCSLLQQYTSLFRPQLCCGKGNVLHSVLPKRVERRLQSGRSLAATFPRQARQCRITSTSIIDRRAVYRVKSIPRFPHLTCCNWFDSFQRKISIELDVRVYITLPHRSIHIEDLFRLPQSGLSKSDGQKELNIG